MREWNEIESNLLSLIWDLILNIWNLEIHNYCYNKVSSFVVVVKWGYFINFRNRNRNRNHYTFFYYNIIPMILFIFFFRCLPVRKFQIVINNTKFFFRSFSLKTYKWWQLIIVCYGIPVLLFWWWWWWW